MTFIHLVAAWLILLATALGIYALIFAMTIKEAERANLTFLHRFMYWIGVVFAVIIPVAMALGLAAVFVIAVAGVLPW